MNKVLRIGGYETRKPSPNGPNPATIRIKKVIIQNFKSVNHGEITFNCGRQFAQMNTDSDILGLYGQNGSGKTAFIDALSILESLMSGAPVDDDYVDCVTVGSECAQIEFIFDLQYKDGKKREADHGDGRDPR